MLKNQWNTTLYEGQHGFVWQHGEDVLSWLAPQPQERILDLGCGTGQLTAKIALVGADVVGIDAAPSMVETAKQHYPHLQFALADARHFQFEQPFDAVFSNAVLHWIPEADAVIRCVNQALKPGGRFVAELGGKGNIRAITTAFYESLVEVAGLIPTGVHSWYFPSLAEYTSVLEQQGFEVTLATLFDRPTPLRGEAGVANWLRMFADRYLSALSEEQQTQVLVATEARLRPNLYREEHWWADYRRLRVVAYKPIV